MILHRTIIGPNGIVAISPVASQSSKSGTREITHGSVDTDTIKQHTVYPHSMFITSPVFTHMRNHLGTHQQVDSDLYFHRLAITSDGQIHLQVLMAIPGMDGL